MILNLAVRQALSMEETKKTLTAAPISIIGTKGMLRMTIVYKITKRNITNLKRTSNQKYWSWPKKTGTIGRNKRMNKYVF